MKTKNLFRISFTFHLLPFTSATKSQSGQALPYFMAMMVVLVLCWAMIVNIAKLLKDRMMMQNAADNAALAVAQYQARVLNVVGYFNYKIAEELAAGTFPVLTPIKLYNQHYVGHPGDAKCKKPGGLFAYEKHEEKKSVQGLRNLVTGLVNAQKTVIDAYPVNAQLIANEIASRQEYNNAGETTGADVAIVVPFTIEGLKKNNQKIKYFSTIVHEVNWLSGFKRKHAHVMLPGKGFTDPWKEDKISWYYIDDEVAFSKRKVTVIATKMGGSSKGYPVLGKLFGLNSWPEIVTVASASAYNPRGPMFPLVKDNCTGMGFSQIPLAAAQLTQSLNQMGDLATQVGDIPIIGGPLAGVVGVMVTAITAVAGVSVGRAITSDETPIKRYDQVAKKDPNNPFEFTFSKMACGWDAHLVPEGSVVVH